MDKTVPEYTNGSKDLIYFISKAENLLTKLNTNDDFFNCLLIDYMQTKLHGKVRDILINSKPQNWPTLKALLQNKYGDPRSKTLLTNNLHVLPKIKRTLLTQI